MTIRAVLQAGGQTTLLVLNDRTLTENRRTHRGSVTAARLPVEVSSVAG